MIGKTNALSSGGGGDFEVINITLKTNQSEHSDLIGATITLKYGNNVAETFTWNGNTITYKVPDKVGYTLECSNIEGYKSPTAIYNAVADNVRQIDLTYQTEIVSVTLNAYNGVSVDGQKVTIDGTEYPYQGSAIIHKVPFGKTYTISVDSKAGLTSPSPKSFTANQSKRDVVMTYVAVKLGVFILDTDGKLSTSDNWNTANNSKAVGVAVLTDNCKFVIAPEDGGKLTWGAYGTTISNILTTTDQNQAKLDYKGNDNTTKIINQASDTNAAKYCRNYTFKNGKKGYLGALGEWQAAYDNKAAVAACMSKIGGKAIYNNFHWSSTQYSSNSAWGLSWSGGYTLDYYSKDTNYYVRAFAAF